MEPIIKVDNVSMCFNLSKEKHESLKEYFLAMVQGRLQYDCLLYTSPSPRDRG